MMIIKKICLKIKEKYNYKDNIRKLAVNFTVLVIHMKILQTIIKNMTIKSIVKHDFTLFRNPEKHLPDVPRLLLSESDFCDCNINKPKEVKKGI